MKSFLILLIALGFTSFAQAMIVTKVKGRKALIDLQGESVQVGQTIRIIDSSNKEVGRMKIATVAKGKALAELTSGQAPPNSRAVGVGPISPNPGAVAAKATPKAVPESPRAPIVGSVLLGMASNTLSLKVGNGTTSQNVDTTGNSVGVGVAAERQYWQPWFRARALVAYEQFNAIGASSISGCDNQTSKDCSTDIKYLSAGLYGKYVKDFGKFNFWGAAGLNFKEPISKSSTALVASSMTLTNSYGLALGVDYTLETEKFLTASVEKQFYAKSDSAEISTVFIRMGLGKTF